MTRRKTTYPRPLDEMSGKIVNLAKRRAAARPHVRVVACLQRRGGCGSVVAAVKGALNRG